MYEFPSIHRAIYMRSLWVGHVTTLPLELKWRYTPLGGTLVKSWYFSSRGHTFSVVHILPTQAPWSRRVCPDIKASRHDWILSLPAEPPVLVLWLNQVTQRFCGEPSQTPRADFDHEPLPCTDSYPWLRLAFLATMRPALDPIRPPGPLSQAYLSLHSSGPFAHALHLQQCKSSRNLHLQYSAKSQFRPRCQSLATPGSDHPLVLGWSSPQSPPW
jgi:hypothetical protein